MKKFLKFSEFSEEYEKASSLRKKLIAVQHPIFFFTMKTIDEELQKITKQKNALLQEEKMISIGRLALGTLHDINNSLTGVLGWIQLAKIEVEEANASGELKESIKVALVCAEKLRDIVKSVIGVVKHVDVFQEVDLNCIANIASEFFEKAPSIKEYQLYKIDVLLEAKNKIIANETEIYRLLLNLTLNARDAMPTGGTITLATSDEVTNGFVGVFGKIPAGSYVKLSVADTGTGIDQRALTKIFQPFFTTKEAGTGIGLSVVREVIEKHHAYIDVKTQAGQGTAFELYFPISVKQEQNVALGRKRALVVEDDESLRNLLQKHLFEKGFEVLTAPSWSKAREICKDSNLSIILTDSLLHQENDIFLSIVEKIKRANPGVRLYLMSGYPSEQRFKEIEKEVAGFIRKPFELDELDGIIGVAFQQI